MRLDLYDGCLERSIRYLMAMALMGFGVEL